MQNNKTSTTDQKVGVSTLARMKGMLPSNLVYYINSGRVPGYEIADGKKLWKLSDIVNWIPEKQKRGRKKT